MVKDNKLIVEPGGPSNREVLVVEDLECCATTVEIALQTIPRVHVRVVETAQQALEILFAAGSQVSALVTDLHLPTMDGFELIERVRAERRTRRLPIIVVSGDTDPQTATRTHRIGANAFFGKPYSCAPQKIRARQNRAAVTLGNVRS
jgi:CheY-like chemotaxis protein